MSTASLGGDRQSAALMDPCKDVSGWGEQQLQHQFWSPGIVSKPMTEATAGPALQNAEPQTANDIGDVALVRDSNVDLTVLALELARDGQPKLDFGHTLEWISRRADEVRSHLVRARNDRAMLRELSRCLSGTHGLHGDKEAFQRSESSYINRVIETGVGIPIKIGRASCRERV